MLHIQRSILPCLLFMLFIIVLARLTIAIPHSSQFYNGPNHSVNNRRAASAPAPITHMLETCLYIRNMNASVKFYRDILGLNNFMMTPKLSAFSMGVTTLLLFHLGETSQDINYGGTPGRGQIAGHGPDQNIINFLGLTNQSQIQPGGAFPAVHPEVSLKLHYALAVEKREEVLKWEAFFKEKNVHIHSTMEWERGGRSVYFFDPDGHVGEIVSRGIWPHW